jgi:hypothetical protein
LRGAGWLAAWLLPRITRIIRITALAWASAVALRAMAQTRWRDRTARQAAWTAGSRNGAVPHEATEGIYFAAPFAILISSGVRP